MSTNGYHNGLTDILDYKMDLLMEPIEGKQFHLFLALQHTTAGLLQYGGGSYQSGLVEEADGCLNLCVQLGHNKWE